MGAEMDGNAMPSPKKEKTRSAWSLVVAGLLWSSLYGWLAYNTNGKGCVHWDMGGTAFVPASSAAAEGYYLPVEGQPGPVTSTTGGTSPTFYPVPLESAGAR
jgi:hypothetical protein